MSRTYGLACVDCSTYLWVGQGWPPQPDEEDRRYIYSGPNFDGGNHTKDLRDFLYGHEGHPLLFRDTEWLCDYHEVGEEDEEPDERVD